MSAMSFEVPEGASVQIFIGKPSLLALPDETGRRDDRPQPHRRHRPVVKVLAAAALLGGGFFVGQHTRLSPTANVATASFDTAGVRPPPPVDHAFPDHALAAEPPTTASPQVPPALAQQLQQPPTVVPPPGQSATSGDPGKNAFGLEN